MLVRRGAIRTSQLVEAVRLKIDSRLPLTVCLVQLGYLKRQDIGKVMQALTGNVSARRPPRR
ncbi:MAG: hypothetical protein KGR26_11710 [Cyanobacteria bacterium REEB65]|nr:hypothetical protein [Cyanobacteria bacterium REEB65]